MHYNPCDSYELDFDDTVGEELGFIEFLSPLLSGGSSTTKLGPGAERDAEVAKIEESQRRMEHVAAVQRAMDAGLPIPRLALATAAAAPRPTSKPKSWITTLADRARAAKALERTRKPAVRVAAPRLAAPALISALSRRMPVPTPTRPKVETPGISRAVTSGVGARFEGPLSRITEMLRTGATQRQATHEHAVISSTSGFRREVLRKLASIAAKLPANSPLRERVVRVIMGAR